MYLITRNIIIVIIIITVSFRISISWQE